MKVVDKKLKVFDKMQVAQVRENFENLIVENRSLDNSTTTPQKVTMQECERKRKKDENVKGILEGKGSQKEKEENCDDLWKERKV